MKVKKYAYVDPKRCVACGACAKECPKGAIDVIGGCFAKTEEELCVGCGRCGKVCPADCIRILSRGESR